MNEHSDAAHIQSGETIRIRGREIPVRTTTLRQDTLRFFVDNPRVYSVLRTGNTEDPTQEEIQNKLLDMDHVKALVQDIKRDRGLTDPVIVRARTLEVLEGNSRLAAYRHLAKLDPIKWGMIKVRILPEDIDEKLVFALLGQYHIKGKKDWAPFEQAGFLYRRHKTHDIPVDRLAQEIGLSKQKVAHLIGVYQFMLDHNQSETARWSYYDEYLKSRIIKKVRSDKFDQLVVDKIKSGEIARAVDVRNRLPLICKAQKPLKRFAADTIDFEEAYDLAVDAGADSTPYARVTKFRKWLAMQETAQALSRTKGETRNKIEFELKKLRPVVESLLNSLSR